MRSLLDALQKTCRHALQRHPCLVALFAGGTATLGLPPVGAWPVLLLGLLVLVQLLVSSKKLRQIFARAWCWYLGYGVAGLYWISWALTHDLARFGWLLPFAILGLPAFLALFGALAASLWQSLRPSLGHHNVWLLMLLLASAEWVRGVAFTGFPWNWPGLIWLETPLGQTGSVVGAAGLTLLTYLAVAVLYRNLAPLPAPPAGGEQGARLALLATILVAMGCWWWGQARLASPLPSDTPPLTVRVVQPSIPPAAKWDATQRESHFQRLTQLTALPPGSQGSPQLVVWPETAFDHRLFRQSFYRATAGAALAPNAILLAGTIRYDETLDQATNSMIALDNTGNVLGSYDKHHLVPFGEYVPFRSFAPVAMLASGVGEFTPGEGLISWRLPGLPLFSPLICYEVIFGGNVVRRDDRPALMVNITNDSWYERTSGPHQHLAQAQMRTIEEGLPLLRAANTGISAIIDARGQIVQSLPLYTIGTLDGALPPALPATWWGRYGALTLLALWLAALGAALSLSAALPKLRKLSKNNHIQ